MNGYTTVDMEGYNVAGSSTKITGIYDTMISAMDTNKPVYLYNLKNGTVVVAPVNPFAYVTASDIPKAVVNGITLSFAKDDTVSHS